MLSLRLPSETYAALRIEAAAAGISIAAYIARLLTERSRRNA